MSSNSYSNWVRHKQRHFSIAYCGIGFFFFFFSRHWARRPYTKLLRIDEAGYHVVRRYYFGGPFPHFPEKKPISFAENFTTWIAIGIQPESQQPLKLSTPQRTTFQRHLMQNGVLFDFPEIKSATMHRVAADRRRMGTRIVRRSYFGGPLAHFPGKIKPHLVIFASCYTRP